MDINSLLLIISTKAVVKTSIDRLKALKKVARSTTYLQTNSQIRRQKILDSR